MVIQRTPTKIDKIVSLQIGQHQENAATQIKMDMSDWITVHPTAGFHVLFKRPGEVLAQPVLSSLEEGILSWTVGNWETGLTGVGYLEVRAIEAESALVAKSRVIPCSIEESVIEDGEVAPQSGWVEEVLTTKTDVETAKTAAETAQGQAEQAASNAASQAAAAVSASNSAQNYASQANRSATDVETLAGKKYEETRTISSGTSASITMNVSTPAVVDTYFAVIAAGSVNLTQVMLDWAESDGMAVDAGSIPIPYAKACYYKGMPAEAITQVHVSVTYTGTGTIRLVVATGMYGERLVAEVASIVAEEAEDIASSSATSASASATTATGAAQTAQNVLNSIPADYSTLSSDVGNLKSALEDTVIPWNAIESNTIAEKTYDNSGTIATNSTFYTVMNIPVAPGQVWYAYSVYSHTSSAYNHKVRKVNFYNGTSYVSTLEYVNQWTIPENVTSMNVSMAYIGNSFDNGRSADDYITIYEEGNRYNHLSDGMRLVDDNVPDGFVSNRMLQNKYGEAWNVISTGTILENTFIRTNGQIVSSTSFYTITNIPVQAGQVWYAFCAYNKSARFVTFYNSSGSAISGYEYIKSWAIPTDVATMSVTLNYTDGVKSSRDYVTSQMFEIIQEIQTEDKKYGNMETRICTINFQFDDGNVKDADIFKIFNNNGFPCGFALISNISTNRIPEYLMYQRNGFEILSHSTDSAGMSSASLDPSAVNTKLQNSRKVLEGYGFIVRGWVTPYSEMNTAFIPLMQRYYDFGTTVYYGEYDGTGTPYQTINDETSKLFRVSLQSTTLENQKKAVDEAIANNGFLTFYGHSADLDGTDNETTANLNSLLSYINSKVAQLRCVVLKPSDAVDYYFHVRHSDYLALLNT